MSNFNELEAKARTIRDELEEGENTAYRVGTLFLELVTLLATVVTTLAKKADLATTLDGYGITDACDLETAHEFDRRITENHDAGRTFWRGIIMAFDGILPWEEYKRQSEGKTGGGAVKWDWNSYSHMEVYWVMIGNLDDGRFMFHDTKNDTWCAGSTPYHYCPTDGAAEYYRHGGDIYRLTNIPDSSASGGHRHRMEFIGSLVRLRFDVATATLDISTVNI